MTLDQLVIELILDPKKLTRGQQQAIASFKQTQEQSKKIAESIEEAGKRIIDVLYKIRSQFISFTAAALEASGVEQFFSNIVKSNADLGRLARSLGLTVEEMSQWRIAIKLSGGAAEDADQAIGSLVDQIQLMRIDPTQATHLLTFLRALSGASGVSFAKELQDVQEGKVNALTNLILKIAQAGGGRNVAQMTTFFRQMGFPPGFIQALTQGEGALRRYLDQAARLRPQTESDIRISREFEASWDRISTAMIRFGEVLVIQVAPKLASFFDWLLDKVHIVGGVIVGSGLGALIGSVVPGVGTVAGGVIGGLMGGAVGALPAMRGGGLNQDFLRRLDEARKAMPSGMSFSIGSGFRTYEEQSRLYANRGSNPYPVARPGTSAHESGLAADLKFSSPAAEAWFRSHMGQFGIGAPVANDPVHFELAKKYAAMAGAASSMSAATGRTTNNNASSEVNIGSVNFNGTNIRDARGAAQEFGPFLTAQQRRALGIAANGGSN